MGRVIVIGGGAGGMLAAGRAAECGARVTLLERNGSLGRKLHITGKGRGNLTNTAGLEEFVGAFGPNGRFLYGALTRFSNNDLVDLMSRLGVPTKVERGGRVFPVSDCAGDVVEALEKWLRDLGVEIRTGARAQGIAVAEDESGRSVTGVRTFSGVMAADAAILATGGITYPRTGSTGDGYRMAGEVGHTVIRPTQSLSALEVKESWASDLQGLSLRNVSATLYVGGKKVGREFGEMVFTHFGVSGPIVLSLSKLYAAQEDKSDVRLSICLKPAVKREELDERLVKDLSGARQLHNYLHELLPRTLVPVFLSLAGIDPETPVNRVTAPQRRKMLDLLYDLRLTVTRARPADEAIVTAGGVSIKEIDPRTMESKLIRGLYFCGEVIDIDAVTGGYNLQAAFSTGWVAGESSAER